MRRHRLRSALEESGQGGRGAPAWMVTYGDLITQVLAFFVLLYSFSSLNEARFRETLAALQAAFGVLPRAGSSVVVSGEPPVAVDPPEEAAEPPTLSTATGSLALLPVERQLAAALEEGHADQVVLLERGDRSLIIHFDAAALFDSGRAEIRREAIPVLDAVGSVLAGIPNYIRVEGHTDSDPMLPGAPYADNWELSGARATSVLRYLHQFHQIPYRRLSISGYADTRPVASNETPEGKARNRRVDIVVLAPGAQP